MTQPVSRRMRPDSLATCPRRGNSSHARLTSESKSIPAVRATPGSRKALDSSKLAHGPLSPWSRSRPTSSANSADSPAPLFVSEGVVDQREKLSHVERLGQVRAGPLLEQP